MKGPLEQGSIIGGRYEVRDYVDEGGMQYVYAAHDQLTNRLVALKTPKNASAKKRFRRSAIVAAMVNHPNVAKTLDYVREGELRFLIEELIDGEDLSKALFQRTRCLDPYLAARVFHHMAKGLAAAHHVGVIHRDMKPSNIMVTGGYSVESLKITDFGIAKLAKEELTAAAAGGGESLSMSQTAVGALPYMAPEAIETPADVTTAVDVWSLGAMMFHLVCGEPPFGSGLKAVQKILNVDAAAIPDFVTNNPQFGPLAKEVISLAMSCLVRNPEDRPSADDLVRKCGLFCYNSSPRREGFVKRIDHGKYGFIRTEAGDVFFHMGSVYGPEHPKVGDQVLFSSYEGGGAPRAYPVVRLLPA